ncbi:NAD-dependent epimerase/dehydratase family protein [Seohaeicola zhoushanensis]|uniref:Epimerase n=1 Tax=Seohaeicola zhoushanensis TaxID=1569283 RepID=A0A8J3H1C2_9RHOB|nr:NAD-dependent epimerase/dehydratase family protein [Seohaeicola zhoushanensis]GHF71873.1 epimerase [Seohaeicola zhoushanensis]
MEKPSVLVLGSTGRIGALLRSRWPAGLAYWEGRAAFADPEVLAAAARGCTAILCLAGVTPSAAARGGDLADNTRLALTALRAGAAAGARVLLASSAAVYGAGGGEETARLEPATDYGRAKVAMERAAAALATKLDVAACALRIGNIAGLDAALGGWRPGCQLDSFPGGATPRRSWIGMVTLADQLVALCTRNDLPTALNIAQPGTVEMGALLDAAGLPWRPRPAPPEAIAEVTLDLTRLAGLLPLVPATPEGLVAEWRASSVV